MTKAPDETCGEVDSLRRSMNDLLVLFALPAMWTGGDLTQIARILLDTLRVMLDADFLLLRFAENADSPPIDASRTSSAMQKVMFEDLWRGLTSKLGTTPASWPQKAEIALCDGDIAVACLQIGMERNEGILVAGSRRPDFPSQSERLLITVAGNQATIALKDAYALTEQRRLAAELDAKVAQRTAELAASNEALKAEITERRRGEAALAASERDLNRIINTIPALAWSARPDGSADFLNQYFLDFLGLPTEQARGGGWRQALHHDDAPRFLEVWQSALRSGLGGEIEARLRRFDGTFRWFLFRFNPLHDGHGKVAKWYGANTDINDRKQAEEELRRSEAFLAQGQQLTATGSMWWDVSSGEIIWSDETFHLMQYPRTAMPTVELAMDRCHPEDAERVSGIVSRGAAAGMNMDFEHRLLMPDGSVKHVHVVLQNVATREKPVFVGATTDITERTNAEIRIRRSEMFLAAGQRISQTGIFSWQIDTDELTFSDELNRIFEFEDSQRVTFERVIERVLPDDLPILAEKMEMVRAGLDNPEYEIRLKARDRSTKFVRVVAQVIEHTDGRRECLGAVQDMTQWRLAEEAQDHLRTELARVTSIMSLGEIAASIAHEVNQPLAGIVTNANTCLRMLTAEPPDILEALETARRTIRDGNRAADVIARLRALFRKKAAAIEPVDLNEATREVITLLRDNLRREKIELQTALADDLPVIGGDRVQLQQVVMNFLRNAMEALSVVKDRRRCLQISTEFRDDGNAYLFVKDSGPGVVAPENGRLFDPFYTTKTGGMGIGLSVSRSIIAGHKGQIWAQQNDGPGLTFGFSIPPYDDGSLGEAGPR